LVLNFWARCWTSVVLLLVAALGNSQAFGRFGYLPVGHDPAFEITPQGFRARYPVADWFRFEVPFQRARAVSVSADEAIYLLAGAPAAPDKLRINLFAAGPEIFSESGFRLKITSIAAPWLTFPGKGTVEQGLPSAPSRWVYVTFRDRQPGVMLVTPSEDTQWIVTGQSGDWTLQTVGPYKGWLRLTLPTGLQPVQSFLNQIGQAAEKVEATASLYTASYPGTIERTVALEREGVTIQWAGGGPLRVPVPLLLAREAGARYENLTPLTPTFGDLADGPQWFAKEGVIRAWFPLRRPGEGRAVAGRNGDWPAPDDPTELPLRLLLARAGAPELAAAQQRLDDYLDGVEMFREPVTGQNLPFGPAGEGVAEAAEAAWIHQALGRVSQPTPNPYLDGLLWRFDPRTFSLAIDDPQVRARASAAVCAAAALSDDPDDLAYAALLQCGLVSESILPVYARKRSIEPIPTERTAPLIFLRALLFDWQSAIPAETSLEYALFSPLRLLAPAGVETTLAGGDVTLAWEATAGPVELLLAYPGAIRLIGTAGLDAVETAASPGRWVCRGQARENGRVTVTIRPTGGGTVPVWRVPGPR
jgi:hypothetical protein